MEYIRILLCPVRSQLIRSFRKASREKKWQLLSACELRILLERQVSGLRFSLHPPLHAPVVDTHDKKSLLVSPALSGVLLLMWVLKAGSWSTAYPCREESVPSSFSQSQTYTHTKGRVWEQRLR